MQHCINDCIKNNLRCITKELTRPQQKAVHEMVRGLFTAGEPILYHLAQNPEVSVKKQAEKYSHHLGNMNVKEKVEEFALRKSLKQVSQNTIIAYDLGDIAKEEAKKMEKLSRVFDGSKKKVTNGF